MSASAASPLRHRDAFAKPFAHASELEIHGVRIRLTSNRADLIAYVPKHVHGFDVVGPAAPQLEVNVLWLEREEGDSQRNAFGGHCLGALGKRMWAGPDELVWHELLTEKHLQLRFRLQGERLAIDAIYRSEAAKKDPGKRDARRHREFFRLMAHFIYYPLAWYLEHFRGWYLLHASGVALGGRALLFGGVGGVGKSTLSAALLSRRDASFLSEDLVFYDAREVYGCYGPIRLDKVSVKLLGRERGGLVRASIAPEAKKKKTLFHADPALRIQRAPLAALVLPRFGRPAGIAPLHPEAAVERLLAINTQSRKVNDYYYFAAALEMNWPRPGRAAGRIAALSELLRDTPAYDLTIDPAEGVSGAVEAVLQLA